VAQLDGLGALPYADGLSATLMRGRSMRAFSGIWRLVAAFVLCFAVLAGCSTRLTSPAPSPSLSDREGSRRSLEDVIARGPVSLRNMQSLVVQVDGVTELEQYWNFDAERYQHVWSVTKSIVWRPLGESWRQA
jgi:hypothetical protein